MTKVNEDYNAELYEGTGVLYDKVKSESISYNDRIDEVDRLSSDYVLSRDLHYEVLFDNAVNGGYSTGLVPIAYRDTDALDRLANIVLYDDLKWSHPDKMSIVEYPHMSQGQESTRRTRTSLIADVFFGDRRFRGRRTISSVDPNSVPIDSSPRMGETFDKDIEAVSDKIIIEQAFTEAGLTKLQKQAVLLFHVEGFTQTEISKDLNVRPEVISRRIRAALAKLKVVIS